jgi:putative ABC transport system permease protein
MVAALIPARNAANVEPIRALQKGRYQVLSAGENRVRRVVALVAVSLSLVCLPLSEYRAVFLAGYFLLIIAGLLIVPFLSLALARLLRRPMSWLRPVEGALAADSLIQAPRRTSATVAALMLSLALVVGQGGVARGSRESIDEWMNNTLNPDLFLSTTQNIASQGAHFPASMERDVEEIPGVAEVQAVRMPRIRFRSLPVMLITAELDKMRRRVKRHMIAGDEATMNRLASEGRGVILSENLSALTNLRLGDTIELPAPAETLRLPIVGIIRDLSNQMGSIILDRRVYIRAFQDDSVDVYRVYLRPGAPLGDVRGRILDRLGRQRHMFVLSNREIRAYIGSVMNQWFGLTYLQVIVAMLVAILGIVNSLTVSISDRRCELGVLRAVGGLRNQVRGTVWMEAAAIGAIGLILGVATGAVNLYYELQVIQHDLTGIPLSYQFPLGIVALLIPVILGSAFASAILPAEAAVRSSLVEALEYE